MTNNNYKALEKYLKFDPKAINSCDQIGRSLLHYAVNMAKNSKMVKFLVINKVNIMPKDLLGRTPEDLAIKSSKFWLVKYMKGYEKKKKVFKMFKKLGSITSGYKFT